MPKKAKIIAEAISGDVSRGVFCDGGFGITHSPNTIMVQFYLDDPDSDKKLIVSRIFLTPEVAKALSKGLRDTVKDFEKNHGQIEESGQWEG
ncbi:MAG: DUF3467 domain-containing protein [Thaumarchaeota archaeon]|nr:DUF3467 domain-containing protein [Nitrososphaerota archaeon]